MRPDELPPRKPSRHRRNGSGKRRTAKMVSKTNAAYDVCSSTGKVQMDHDRAAGSAKTSRERYGEATSEYHCDDCGWWHIGRTPAKLKDKGRKHQKPSRVTRPKPLTRREDLPPELR